MLTSDLIAIGILVLCIVLALFGVLKWLFRFFAGVALGLLILSCIGLLLDNPKFDQLTKGKLSGGTVIPCVRSQVRTVGEFLSRSDEEPHETVAMND
ncbi:MAG: hypothetical protein ACYTBS_22205 [Planctomycetota bacterium]|jgi:uncharacterized membrane protein YraQ (UPF0718 family)